MVFAGVCFDGNGRQHFIADKAKANAELSVETLSPNFSRLQNPLCYLAL